MSKTYILFSFQGDEEMDLEAENQKNTTLDEKSETMNGISNPAYNSTDRNGSVGGTGYVSDTTEL